MTLALLSSWSTGVNGSVKALNPTANRVHSFRLSTLTGTAQVLARELLTAAPSAAVLLICKGLTTDHITKVCSSKTNLTLQTIILAPAMKTTMVWREIKAIRRGSGYLHFPGRILCLKALFPAILLIMNMLRQTVVLTCHPAGSTASYLAITWRHHKFRHLCICPQRSLTRMVLAARTMIGHTQLLVYQQDLKSPRIWLLFQVFTNR